MTVIEIAFGILLGFCLINILQHGLGTDDTDPSFWNRSGLTVYTDNKTKLQYLSTGSGGITPRLDKFGKHMKKGD